MVLTRELTPDGISRKIASVQIQAGYDPDDSQWTHAAVYVGDGWRVCEASFDSILAGGDVRLAPLWNYCGNHAIRVRRPLAVGTKRDVGWLMVVEALRRLNQKYDFLGILRLAWEIKYGGSGFWLGRGEPVSRAPLVCSTFYADVHNHVTRRLVGDINGICFPAYLSQCDGFSDVKLEWLRVR